MNRILITISTVFLSYIIFGFYLSQYQLDLFGKNLKNQNIFYNYNLHQNVYTNLSIGSGSFTSISEESKQIFSKFILFTDLNPIVNLDNDRYLQNTGQLFGAKIDNQNNSFTVYSPLNKDISTYTDLYYLKNNINHVLVIDHLDTNKLPLDSSDGLDVINLKNISKKVWTNKKISTLWSLLFYPFNPKIELLRLYRDPDEELKIFDEKSQHIKTNLYLSSEATAKAIPIANWLIKFPSYENVFNIASERLLVTSELSHNIEQDKLALFKALKSGSFYISIDTLGDSTGFETYILSKNQYTFMGQNAHLDSQMRLYYKLPKEPNAYYEVVIFKNGQRLDYRSTPTGDFSITEKGVYRLQVRLQTSLPFPDAQKWLTWIFTNNFYIN